MPLTQVQKAIAQLKLAFDNLDRQKESLSRDLLVQMFEFVRSSTDPAVKSLMPPAAAELASIAVASRVQPTHKPPPPGWPPHLPPSRHSS